MIERLGPSAESPNYARRRAVVASGLIAAAGIGLAAPSFNEAITPRTIDVGTATVTNGGDMLSAVNNTVDSLLLEQSVDPSALSGFEEQEYTADVYDTVRSINEQNGTTEIQPGDQATVELQRNGFGQVSVNVEPHSNDSTNEN